ncbi:hypothetical protein FUAX_46660 (plasmid) [Fulvitalea axinellae]|uniref:Uncharacterized protein n=1 Tax=Fulvitalea axinellae TaxID=1182444 RepID=A0AAU9D0F8_9BACT|nr:hypothetical protein FUAX_46660 [Fulvitalea axinellae]
MKKGKPETSTSPKGKSQPISRKNISVQDDREFLNTIYLATGEHQKQKGRTAGLARLQNKILALESDIRLLGFRLDSETDDFEQRRLRINIDISCARLESLKFQAELLSKHNDDPLQISDSKELYRSLVQYLEEKHPEIKKH